MTADAFSRARLLVRLRDLRLQAYELERELAAGSNRGLEAARNEIEGEAQPRLLEMGVEPWAVDIALSGVLAQRLLRKLCSACQGAGCEHCHGTGYRGRMVITEVLDRGAEESTYPLQEMARRLADTGQTTHQEVARVLGGAA